MREYIEREALMEEIEDRIANIGFTSPYQDDITLMLEGMARVKDSVEDFPAADVVSKAAFDQVMWERDVAIQQLREDYGVGLGEKKAADVVERKRGEWVVKNGRIVCSRCDALLAVTANDDVTQEILQDSVLISSEKYCYNCGADMRGV